MQTEVTCSSGVPGVRDVATSIGELRPARSAVPVNARDPRFGAFPMSLGLDVLHAHGADDGRGVVFGHNYTSAERSRRDGYFYPPNLTPDPATDFAVAIQAVAATRPGETALTLPLQPGMERYLRERGVLAETAKLIEVNPEVARDEAVKLGWPYTDIVTLAAKENALPLGVPVVLSLPTESAGGLCSRNGGIFVQRSSALMTNNKVQFQLDAERFGYTPVRGFVIESLSDLNTCVSAFANASRVWVKHATAAGGDAVIRVDGPITLEGLVRARERLNQLEEQTLAATGFRREGLANLPQSFVVQLDAGCDPRDPSRPRSLKTIGGALFRVSLEGKVEIHSYHEQETDAAGVFYGSKPFYPSPEVQRLIDTEIQAVGRYCAEELSLFGNVGIDLVVTEDERGRVSVELIELNGRPNATTISRIVAEAVGAPYWQQVTLKANQALNTFEDVARLLGAETLEPGENGPRFVVLGLSSLYRINANGERELVFSTNSAKVLVIGNSYEQVRLGLQKIAQITGR